MINPGIENNTPHTKGRIHRCLYGYRKRYLCTRRSRHPHHKKIPLPSRVRKIVPKHAGRTPLHNLGYRKRYPTPNVQSHSPHGYRKRYPALEGEHPHIPHGYRKRYPAERENNTSVSQASTPPSRVSKTIPSTLWKLARSFGYRKQYPAHQGDVPSPSRVSKTIPNSWGCHFLPIFMEILLK